jgi:hypothetical protein
MTLERRFREGVKLSIILMAIKLELAILLSILLETTEKTWEWPFIQVFMVSSCPTIPSVDCLLEH